MTETEESNIGPLFAERLDQFKAAGERYATECQEIRTMEGDIVAIAEETATIAAHLLKRGFPYRHVNQLPALHGKGLEAAVVMAGKIASGDFLIVLVGNRGPGKTQMATYWAKEFLKSSTSVRYTKCADLIGEIKATWHDGGSRIGTEADILRKYRKVAYLVIDEFHERGGSDWEARCLINLLDHRYDDMKATVLIANLSMEEAKKQINPSILDRANETGGVIVCDWPSYRG